MPPAPRRIAPSILSADFGRLTEEVHAVVEAGADWIHLDVMDGHFVPNLTIGPAVVKAVRKATRLPLDVHLMITDPARYAPIFADAGADWISVHPETNADLPSVFADIRERGAHAAIAINPDTPVESVRDLLGELDMLLVMSVHPGFGGQAFIAGSLAKLETATRLRAETGARCVIEVDGGITVENAGQVAAAGAEVLVAGSAIFRAPDYAQAIASLRASIEHALAS